MCLKKAGNREDVLAFLSARNSKNIAIAAILHSHSVPAARDEVLMLVQEISTTKISISSSLIY